MRTRPTAPGTPPSVLTRRTNWGLVLVVALLTALATWGQWAWRLDQVVYDTGLSTWARQPSDQIVVVTIDEASLQTVGRWPWRRAIHAEAVRRIAAGRPKAILLDLLLSEPEPDPQQDALLAQALSAAPVVLPTSHTLDGTPQGRDLRPVAPLDTAALLAHADVAADADGTVRRAYLWAGKGAQRLPHPALALLQAAHDPQAKAYPPPAGPPESELASGRQWHREAPVRIAFGGPDKRIRHVSYAALLRGDVPPETWRGRYVLIGATAQGLGDIFQTPLSSAGSGMAGIDVIAQTLDTLLHPPPIQQPPLPLLGLVHALLAGLLVLGFRWLTPRGALLTCLGVASAALVGAWAALAADLWWPPFGLVLGALVAYPLWSWRRLERTARELEAELRTMAAEPGIHVALPGPPHAGRDFMDQRTDALTLAGAELRQARQLLANTLATLPDALFVIDQHHVVVQANHQACAMSGHPNSKALIGRNLDDILSPYTPSDGPDWQTLLEKARHSRLMVGTEASHPRGRHYLVQMVSTDDTHAEAGAIVCATDVTALRQAELQRSELLGFIAHDIRSPQASLISLVELHRLGGSLPIEESLGSIDALARQTLDLCEELLQVMRAETRPIAPREVDLITLAEECIHDVLPQARLKPVSVRATWMTGTQAPAMLDDYLVHRALVNLLSNAIKFSPRETEVTVSVEARGTHHVIAVRDQGPGIPEAELGRLFKRYERVEQGRPSKLAAGIGLGLVFIDTVARRHGGEVKVHNRPGEGACFELWLPMNALPGPTPGPT